MSTPEAPAPPTPELPTTDPKAPDTIEERWTPQARRERQKRLAYDALLVVAFLLVLVVMLAPFMLKPILSGQAGVLYRAFTGTDEDELMDEGLHVIFPADTVYVYDTRVQNLARSIDVLSFNGLAVNVTINCRFRVIREELPQLHVEIGPEYVTKMVDPVVQAAVREVIGRYRPEELYTTHSATVQDEVDQVAQAAIAGYHIELMMVVIENMKLPAQVNLAIEEKLRAQQESQAYEFRLTREAQEAERKRLEAEGKDLYNQVLSRSLTPQLLQFLHIDAMRALATSHNAKVIVMPGGDVPQMSMPLMIDTTERGSGPAMAPLETTAQGSAPVSPAVSPALSPLAPQESEP